jgi:dTDP-4-dehydrorhamnose reductase
MLRLGKEKESLNVIYDQVGCPTYASDLVEAILDIMTCNFLRHDQSELAVESIPKSVTVYHYSNEGVCSWYDFALAIFEISNISCQVSPIETKGYPSPAKRPGYSILNKAIMKSNTDIKIPFWKGSLGIFLRLLGVK